MFSRHVRALLRLFAPAAIVLGGCGGSTDIPTNGWSKSTDVQEIVGTEAAAIHAQNIEMHTAETDTAHPPDLVIAPGAVVRFHNGATIVHNASLTDESDRAEASYALFDRNLAPGEALEVRFQVPGVYRYVCRLHQPQSAPKGTITVKEGP